MKKGIVCLLIGGLLCAPLSSGGGSAFSAQAAAGGGDTAAGINALPYYRDVAVQETALPPYTGETLRWRAVDCYTADETFATSHIIDGAETAALVWDGEQSGVTFRIDAPEDALYEIGFTYYPLEGAGSAISRKVSINGEIPFQEAAGVNFLRRWRNPSDPLVNSQGDEIAPFPEEVFRPITAYLSDADGKFDAPFAVPLRKGTNTVQLEYIAEPMAITAVLIRAVTTLPAYSAVRQTYDAEGKTQPGQSLTFQAEALEHIVETTDSVINVACANDPSLAPRALRNRLMNMIGGGTFSQGNQAVTWTFHVETAGLYTFGLRVGQNTDDNMPVFRQIAVDGEVPFQEFACYRFDYHRDWYTQPLADEEGAPYALWLDAGDHTLTLTAKMGVYGEVMEDLIALSRRYSQLIRRIKMITGNDPDLNYDYEIVKNVPGILDDFAAIREGLSACENSIFSLSGKKSVMSNGLRSIVVQIDQMLENPDRITKRLTDMETALTNIGNYINTLQNSALGIDQIWVNGAGEEFPQYTASVWAKLYTACVNFLNSFFKDYNSVHAVAEQSAEETITVWVGRGKEWAEIIKQMSDASFSPEQGVGVDLNIIPSSQLSSTGINVIIMSVAAGTAPDAVLGVGGSLPVEYAIRHAVTDLSGFPDFEEIRGRFSGSLFTPLSYQGGVYALPESVNWRSLFYRTDIFGELSLQVPDTWEELYDDTLPALYQNGLQCYIPMLFDVFLFQNGGSYYTEDLLHSALDSKEAFQGFRELCELYTNYSIPVSASFFNRFRTGEMPLGVGDFSMYITLASAAPELDGSWAIAPLPGKSRADGTVDRSSSGALVDAAVILSGSRRQEASWKFLKWWTSDDVQARFSRLIESSLGMSARYNSANLRAFSTLGYTSEEKRTIQVFFDNNRESEVVLGGYYTSRYLNNAWNSVVVSNQDLRDAYEEAVENIRLELLRRQEEFGVAAG